MELCNILLFKLSFCICDLLFFSCEFKSTSVLFFFGQTAPNIWTCFNLRVDWNVLAIDFVVFETLSYDVYQFELAVDVQVVRLNDAYKLLDWQTEQEVRCFCANLLEVAYDQC